MDVQTVRLDARRCAAPPVSRSRSATVSHSACHAPAARATRGPSMPGSSIPARHPPSRGSRGDRGHRILFVRHGRRPTGASSATSPNSVEAIAMTSVAGFDTAPAAIPRPDASAATGVRVVCHGATCRARPSSAARASAIARPCGWTAARVPAAPPNWTGSADSARSIRVTASSRPVNQDTASAPNVVGSACCPRVRATIGVVRCRRASSAAAFAATRRSASTCRPALRDNSISAESITSWLVAPTCTADLGTPSVAQADRRICTSGITGLPPAADRRPRSAMSSAPARRAWSRRR